MINQLSVRKRKPVEYYWSCAVKGHAHEKEYAANKCIIASIARDNSIVSVSDKIQCLSALLGGLSIADIARENKRSATCVRGRMYEAVKILTERVFYHKGFEPGNGQLTIVSLLNITEEGVNKACIYKGLKKHILDNRKELEYLIDNPVFNVNGMLWLHEGSEEYAGEWGNYCNFIGKVA